MEQALVGYVIWQIRILVQYISDPAFASYETWIRRSDALFGSRGVRFMIFSLLLRSCVSKLESCSWYDS